MAENQLPRAPAKPALYDLVVVHGNFAYVSGQVSRVGDGVIGGHLEPDDDIDQAREAARVSVRRCLSVLQERLGGLDRIERVISMRGFISASPGFKRHPEVLDAASQILMETFGERGGHVRAALGVSSIPGGGLTEIEMIVAIHP